MENMYRYVIGNGGICSEDSYPYTATEGTCQPCTPVVQLTSLVDLPPNDDAALQTAVARQPVAVALQANEPAIRFYSSGIFTGTCSAYPDHAMVVTGWGYDPSSGMQYWRLKNDWGAGWGEGGFIRMWRNPSLNDGAGQCGMYMVPSYPVQ